MPRVHSVEKALKDPGKCRRCGVDIKAGDSYFWFKNRIGRTSLKKIFCAAHRPKPSEMTTSDKLSELYAAQEECESAVAGADDYESIAQALRDCAEAARGVAEQYRDSVQNMPENLQQSSTAQECEEKADNIEGWADELDSAADEVDSNSESIDDDTECSSCNQPYSAHTDEAREQEESKGEEADPACESFEDPGIDEARGLADDAIGNLSL